MEVQEICKEVLVEVLVVIPQELIRGFLVEKSSPILLELVEQEVQETVPQEECQR